MVCPPVTLSSCSSSQHTSALHCSQTSMYNTLQSPSPLLFTLTFRFVFHHKWRKLTYTIFSFFIAVAVAYSRYLTSHLSILYIPFSYLPSPRSLLSSCPLYPFPFPSLRLSLSFSSLIDSFLFFSFLFFSFLFFSFLFFSFLFFSFLFFSFLFFSFLFFSFLFFSFLFFSFLYFFTFLLSFTESTLAITLSSKSSSEVLWGSCPVPRGGSSRKSTFAR